MIGTGAVVRSSQKTVTKSFYGTSEVSLQGPICTNGQINAIANDANFTYIGGSFTQVGRCMGGGVPIDGSSSSLSVNYSDLLAVNGTVSAVVSDGAGGWYIGGSFSAVGGVTRNNIAHLLDDRTLDTAWNPNASSSVYALAVSGNTVYAGGLFTTIGGATRNHIAALDSSGNATAWNPNANSTVSALAVSGSTVYAGGTFTAIGSQSRTIAILDDTSGSLLVKSLYQFPSSTLAQLDMRWEKIGRFLSNPWLYFY